MDSIHVALVLAGAALSAVLLTWAARNYALQYRLLDIPNDRSSHTKITARGGGVGVVIPVLFVTAALWFWDQLESAIAFALLVGGGMIAVVGWIDDHRPQSATLRGCVHLLAAAVTVIAIWPDCPPLVCPIYVLGIAWFVNLYNFLDGTDGYAATQSVCAATAAALVFQNGGNYGVMVLSITIAGSSLGFLVWNWAPAKIFMGDVGSCFLGFVFGTLALYGHTRGVAPAWLWLLIIGVFFWDATLTLLQRVWYGKVWHQAHREHAYQRLHQQGWGHDRIAVGLLLVNLVVLWPLVWVAMVWDNLALVSVMLGSLTLIAVWWWICHKPQLNSDPR